jgi:phosphoglycolate phosphatase-like HAD superfamily hydrolase
MIGDSARDIDAAMAAGAKAILISPNFRSDIKDVPVFANLSDAVSAILAT